MPKYRFEFIGDPGSGPVFAELASVDAAVEEARRAMAETVMDMAIERRNPTGLATKVYDAAGYHVATVRFTDVLEEPETTGIEPGVIRAG